jgi:hypothetical protein
MAPTDVTEHDSNIGVMRADVFGAGWGHLRIAHLARCDRIGLELFEFGGNEAPRDNLSFRQHGTSQVAIQDPDLLGLLAKIPAVGSKQRMPVRAYFPEKKPYQMVSVKDPFVMVFENYSHSHDLTCSAGAHSSAD